jgi:ferredoxin--NADP+ reductase
MIKEIVYPDVDINVVRAKEPVEVTLVENRIATAAGSPNFIRHLSFDVSGTPLEGKFIAGQSIGVIPAGVDENGKPHKVRLYSVSSPSKGEDGHGKHVSTTVKRVIDEHWETKELYAGVCSNYLSSLTPGSKVMVTGPSGKRFILPENAADYNYLFFGAGTGVAPFRGMVMDLMEAKSQNEIALIFGCPYRTDLLYRDYFEPLAENVSNFHYLKSISREAPRGDGSKYYVQYQLIDNKELLEPILKQENTLIYVCGLKGMETGIYQILAQQGFLDYLKVSDELMAKDPSTWSWDDIKSVKPSDRMHVEVY